MLGDVRALLRPNRNIGLLFVESVAAARPLLADLIAAALVHKRHWTRNIFFLFEHISESLYFIKFDNKMACSFCSNAILYLNIHIVF